MVQLSHPNMTTGKTIALTRWTFVSKIMSLLFNMLSRFVILFFQGSSVFLISWLQSPSAVILWKSLSCVRLLETPWTIYSPWNSPGHNTGVGGRSLLQGIFLTQGSNPGLLHCRWMDPLPSEPPGKPKDTEVDSLSLLLRIFPTQESNWGILHCRQILY